MELDEQCYFINDGIGHDDIQQGELGDCWFLSALASLAVDLPDRYDNRLRTQLAEKVIQRQWNNTAMRNGSLFTFQFYRLGEWHMVSVDRVLPVRRRALPSATHEWWVPLIEKAYAKFNGSYDNIDGGVSLGFSDFFYVSSHFVLSSLKLQFMNVQLLI